MSTSTSGRRAITVGFILAAAVRLEAQVPITQPLATARDAQAAASAAIPRLMTDSAAAAALATQYVLAIADTNARIAKLTDDISATLETIKALQTRIDQIKAQIVKSQAAIVTLDDAKAKALAEVTHSKSSLILMRQAVNDVTVAARLLEAMRQRDPTVFALYIDQRVSPSSIVSVDILSPDAIRMVFKVGTLTQCIATKSICSTQMYTIVK